MIFQYFYFCI